MSDQVVRVGIIGLGRISNAHIKGFKEAEGAEIAAVCDVDGDRMGRQIREHGLEDAFATTDHKELLALGQADAVSLPLPDHLHHPFALDAIASGKHVLCEKPLAMNAAQAEEMLQAAEAAGIVHAVHMQRRYEAPARYVADLIAEGALGALRHFRARMSVHRISDPDVKLEWRLQADRGCYGVLGDLGAHALDLAHFTMGEAAGEMVAAAGIGAIFIEQRELEGDRGEGEVTAWDAINFATRYESGTLGSFQLSRFAPGYSEWEIDGQDASVRVRGGGSGVEIYERRPRDDQIPASEYTEREIPEEYLDGRTLFDAFIGAIRGEEQVRPNFADGLRVARELDAIHEAAFVEEHHE